VRRTVPGLPTPHPIGELLPGLYQDDEFAQRLTSGLDEVIAPIFATLDNISGYTDPALAPTDFLEWLGTWVGAIIDDHWPLDRRRAVVAAAGELYQWLGTERGLRALVRLVAGIEPEIEESGSASWSQTPLGPVPGTAEAFLVVRLRVEDPDALDLEAVKAIVAAATPAHVPHRVEVVRQ
jgi:phage tail-like protein